MEINPVLVGVLGREYSFLSTKINKCCLMQWVLGFGGCRGIPVIGWAMSIISEKSHGETPKHKFLSICEPADKCTCQKTGFLRKQQYEGGITSSTENDQKLPK